MKRFSHQKDKKKPTPFADACRALVKKQEKRNKKQTPAVELIRQLRNEA